MYRRIEFLLHTLKGVVYQLNCQDCDAFYIGKRAMFSKRELNSILLHGGWGSLKSLLRSCMLTTTAIASNGIKLKCMMAKEQGHRKRVFLESWQTTKIKILHEQYRPYSCMLPLCISDSFRFFNCALHWSVAAIDLGRELSF